jgi:hypothetical protein
MPFSVQDVLNDALVLNRTTQEPAMVSEGAVDIIAAINRSLSGIYAVGARVNPAYHGKVLGVAEDTGVWARPEDAELVSLILDSAGVRVLPSTPQEPRPDPDKPCVVRWGRVYRRPSGAAAPTGSLTFWYSRRPEFAADREDEVDLEDAFRSLLVYDLGTWFARRDERWDEAAGLIQERDRHFQMYLASLEHESVGDVRNVGQTGFFDSPSVVDLKALLLSLPPQKPGT